jgi:hypothetical protein
MYLGGDESLTSRDWIDTHVRIGHGPLGALYPVNTWTKPNPHGVMKEGDSPSWLYFLPNGLSDPQHPQWGSWGGRFEPLKAGSFTDAKDTVDSATDSRAAVWRWRPAFQADFQARMEWCVKPRAQANHAPLAILNGDRSRQVLHPSAKAATELALSAAGSSDPDGNKLTYRWFIYPEPGTYRAPVTLRSDGPTATIAMPPDITAGQTIHVVLEVTDDGTPPLTSYRRAVVEAR